MTRQLRLVVTVALPLLAAACSDSAIPATGIRAVSLNAAVKGGNGKAAAKKDCKANWQNLTNAEGVPFASEEECLGYVKDGGIPTQSPPPVIASIVVGNPICGSNTLVAVFTGGTGSFTLYPPDGGTPIGPTPYVGGTSYAVPGGSFVQGQSFVLTVTGPGGTVLQAYNIPILGDNYSPCSPPD